MTSQETAAVRLQALEAQEALRIQSEEQLSMLRRDADLALEQARQRGDDLEKQLNGILSRLFLIDLVSR